MRFCCFCRFSCVNVRKREENAIVCIQQQLHSNSIHVFVIIPILVPIHIIIFRFSFNSMLFNCRDSNPVLILKPAELAGMSLENRLTSYDWQSQFDVFQRVTRNGSFRPICLDAKNNMVTVSTNTKIHKNICH